MSSSFEDIRIDELIPEQLRDTAKNLIDFLKVYYTEKGNPSDLIDFIAKNKDIDQVANVQFLNALSETIAKGIPESGVIEKTFLLKRLVDYYNFKGTDKSIIIFFQLFYDKVVRINEPWKKVFEPSSANYGAEKFIRITSNGITDPYKLEGKLIQQKSEFGLVLAQGLVKRVTVEFYDQLLYTLHFDENSESGQFVQGAKIYSYSDDSPQNNNIEYGTPYLSLNQIVVDNGGINFQIGDIIYLDDAPYNTFQIRVNNVDTDGRILKVGILQRGAGNSNGFNRFLKPSDEGYPFRVRRSSRDKDVIITPPSTVSKGLFPADDTGEPQDLELTLRFSILCTGTGETTNNKGLLSEGIVLQNGNYYNKFVYEIESDVPFENYKDTFDTLIHPVGYNVWNNLKIETAPPINFRDDINLTEVSALLTATFQPGGSNRSYTIYGGDPNNNTPDERVYLSPAGSIGLDTYTDYQSPYESPSVLNRHLGITGDPGQYRQIFDDFGAILGDNTNFFLEDYLRSSPTLRELTISGSTGGHADGTYIPGYHLSPGFVTALNTYVATVGTTKNSLSQLPKQPSFGKFNGRYYFYRPGEVDAIIFKPFVEQSSPRATFLYGLDATSEWRVVRRAGSSLATEGLSTAHNMSGHGDDIPPTTNQWSNNLSTASFTYGKVITDDGFTREIR